MRLASVEKGMHPGCTPLACALLLLFAQGACTQAQSGARPPDPRSDATALYDTHMPADDAFASLDAPDNCPTRFVSYGTKTSTDQVIDYFEDRNLHETDGIPNHFGNPPKWTGERLNDGVPEVQVDVWTGPDHGHTEWATVFTIATARCELTAAARYSVDPRRLTGGAVPKAQLVNTGDLVIEYGLAYEIQRRGAGRWHRLSFGNHDGIRCAFPGVGLMLSPGESDTQAVAFCNETRRFKPGLYRVLKTISFETYSEEPLRARFRVVRPGK